MAQKVYTLKWQWAGHTHMPKNRSSLEKRIIQWRPRLSKRNVEYPLARWGNDLRSVTGRDWLRKA